MGDFQDKVAGHMEIVQRFFAETVEPDATAHQLVHLQELLATYLGTMTAFVDSVWGYPAQPDSFTRPEKVEFILHRELGGLLRMRHEDGSNVQQARVPYSAARVGPIPTYQELANIFRTSTVNLQRVERTGLKKCKAGLRVLRDER